jgi:hypothetical protein
VPNTRTRLIQTEYYNLSPFGNHRDSRMHRVTAYSDEKFISLLCSRRRMERKPALSSAKGQPNRRYRLYVRLLKD